jgi:hypothetical protein
MAHFPDQKVLIYCSFIAHLLLIYFSFIAHLLLIYFSFFECDVQLIYSEDLGLKPHPRRTALLS